MLADVVGTDRAVRESGSEQIGGFPQWDSGDAGEFVDDLAGRRVPQGRVELLTAADGHEQSTGWIVGLGEQAVLAADRDRDSPVEAPAWDDGHIPAESDEFGSIGGDREVADAPHLGVEADTGRSPGREIPLGQHPEPVAAVGLAERDLATGRPTGVRLDAQMGSVGDLAITADGTELVGFGGNVPVVPRWRLDGRVPIAIGGQNGLLAETYDPSGRLLMAVGGGEQLDAALWDPATGEVVDELAGIARVPLWETPD